ncbi:L-threonylcarbamoyladenylate synthase [Kocuria sp.]|uniref:L-threonylcarbamoyladenylate synthase n=1 Tax=Kocuria sp. TaxID=1871328 RepID=UPI0025C45836|nr:L-threonylcarbamoyladenylate synthase [Kocuria sp.]
MSEIRSCGTPQELEAAVTEAAGVVADGECLVLPTDTVYGIGCDAFSAPGVQGLLGAKGRTREMPPPVLIARPEVIDGLADQVSDDARALAQAFWPGALTIICWAQPTLGWDLGETHGTVALRVPDDAVTRAVLERVGPMAVSSANRTGMPAARTAEQAREMLQDRVALYLDDGPRPAGEVPADARDVASTIVDCTGETPVVLRHGAITLARLREVVPNVDGGTEPTAPASGESPEASAASGAGPAVSDGDAAASSQGSPAGDAVSADGAGSASETVPTSGTAPGSGTSPETGGPVTEDATVAARERDLAIDRDTAASTQSAHQNPEANAPEPFGAGTTQADGSTPADEDLVTDLVRSSPAEARPFVDQGRERTPDTEPRWDGTGALSMAEAQRLVAGETENHGA